MAGFFKIPHDVHRALRRDPNAYLVYCELASRARWTAGTCLGSHGVVELAAGQCVIGRSDLATALGLSEQTIRTSLNRLARLGAVTIESTKRGSIATLVDYSQNADSAPTVQPSSEGEINQASGSESTIRPTTNEVKKEEEEEDPETHAQHAREGSVVVAYDPTSVAHRIALARAFYARVAVARDELIAELGLVGQVRMPRSSTPAEPIGFRDLKLRIESEGDAAPEACEVVITTLVREAREERSVTWLSDKAFTEGGWRQARNGGSKPHRSPMRSVMPESGLEVALRIARGGGA